jgi:hypothetical protein
MLCGYRDATTTDDAATTVAATTQGPSNADCHDLPRSTGS